MVIATQEELKAESSFSALATDAPVFRKLLGFCHKFRLSASDFANHWDAFSLKHNIDKIGPNEDLNAFERFLETALQHKTPAKQFSMRTPGTTDKSYNKDTIHMLDADDFLEPSPVNPSRNKRSTFDYKTPDKRQRGAVFAESPIMAASPASQVAYSKRTNAGNVEFVLNDAVPREFMTPVPKRGEDDVAIGVFKNAQMQPYRYMFEKLADKADALDERIEKMGKVLCTREKVDETSHVKMPRQDNVHVIGRICSDANEGKFNDKSVMLEGLRDQSAGERVYVDLSEIDSFSLFPGQIVLAEGLNTEGHRLVVQKISQNARRNHVMTPGPELAQAADKGGLRIVAAAGPYTFDDDLSFTPLDDLLEKVVQESPDVLILMGPFLDAEHSLIKNPTGELAKMTYKEVFTECVIGRLQSLLEQTHCTQIVVVPAPNDIHHDPIFPQPPLELGLTHKRLHTVSNPCTLKVNELCVGVCTADVLRHLTGEEIARVPQGQSVDRMGRLVNHLIEQHSYYPLCPAHPEMDVDYLHLEQTEMPATPDILIVPSKLNHFAKEVQRCIAVNPGRLTKGQAAGTYSSFTVHPVPRDFIEKAGDKKVRHMAEQRTRTEIVRI